MFNLESITEKGNTKDMPYKNELLVLLDQIKVIIY